MQITFASYNIHKAVGVDGRRDADRIVTVLREIDADIIALQECDYRFGERESVLPKAMLDETPWQHVPVAKRARSLGWHGNALLVRREFEILDGEPLTIPTLEPRGAVRGDIMVQGRRVRALGMHLDLSGLRRRDQLRAVLHHCEACESACPTVLLGDFNQWGRANGVLRELGHGWNALPIGNSFPSRRPLAPLDRIVHSPGWTCVDASVHRSALASVASDHLPVRATLDLRD